VEFPISFPCQVTKEAHGLGPVNSLPAISPLLSQARRASQPQSVGLTCRPCPLANRARLLLYASSRRAAHVRYESLKAAAGVRTRTRAGSARLGNRPATWQPFRCRPAGRQLSWRNFSDPGSGRLPLSPVRSGRPPAWGMTRDTMAACSIATSSNDHYLFEGQFGFCSSATVLCWKVLNNRRTFFLHEFVSGFPKRPFPL
jgi:hypothetical protein